MATHPPRIGPYRVLRELGHGGMGVVYEAVNDKIQRPVALKVLNWQFSRDPEVVKRFCNEARAANIIQHPGIVGVSEAGQLESGETYLVMELLRGETLRQRLSHGSLRPQAVRIGRQIAAALSAAHHKGIIHRDLKPDNLMLVKDSEVAGGERVKVLDFGLAKLTEDLPDDQRDALTKTGTVLGTPTYMAPEQCRGSREINDRADVYALGILLYQLLSGMPPFHSRGAAELLAKHIYEVPPDLASVAAPLPKDLSALVARMLVKPPAERPSMAAVLATLERLGDDALQGTTPTTPVFNELPTMLHAPGAAPPQAPATAPPRPARQTATAPQQPFAAPRWLLPAAGALIVALLAIIALLLRGR